MFDVPILFLIFNRPDTTSAVFDVIKMVKPKKLFIAADGYRKEITGEKELCLESRKVIDKIDWECEVKTLFREENLGCKRAVSSAIDWFFENVDEGIILEDDCLPDPSFFKYCKELLSYYRNNEKIMCISGDNFQNGTKRGNSSYYFSIYPHCWGWATWKRAWDKFDIEMKTFPKFAENKMINNILHTAEERGYWLYKFRRSFEGTRNSWAYIWTYTCFSYSGLTCLPNVNLVTNIGFGDSATHTVSSNQNYASLKTKSISFPLVHPKTIIPNIEADQYTFGKLFLTKNTLFDKIKQQIKKILS